MSRAFIDIGKPVRPFEGWHFATDHGIPIVMLEEDFATYCPLGVFVFGILESVQSLLDGNLAFQVYTNTKKAAWLATGSLRCPNGLYPWGLS
jgi:hypothetical protein